MHLQRIREKYPRVEVEVAYVVAAVNRYIREESLPSFNREFEVSYTPLDDRKNQVVTVYGLGRQSSVPKNLIIDKEGFVRLVGRSLPVAEMEERIDSLLGKSGEPDLSTPQEAIDALKAPESYSRWMAARALGEMNEKTAVEPLIAALSDPSEGVREFAAEALGRLGDPRSVEPLRLLLEGQPGDVRLAAMKALAVMQDPGVVEPLIRALSTESETVREMAAEALGRIGEARAAGPLLTALDDKSGPVRLAAVEALGKLKEERAVAPLVRRLVDSALQAPATDALVEIGRPDLMRKVLEEDRAVLRCADKREGAAAYIQLGHAYRGCKAYDDAIASYRKAARLSPSDETLHANLGDVYRDRGMMDEALAEYDTSIAALKARVERGSRSAAAYNELAWFYVQKKIRPQDALSLAKKAVEMAPRDADVLDTLGWAYLQNGQTDEALRTFASVFAIDPEMDSGWKGVYAIAGSSVPPEVFLKFCDDLDHSAPNDPRLRARTKAARTEFRKNQGASETALPRPGRERASP